MGDAWRAAVALIGLASALALVPAASASHNEDLHSANMRLLANSPKPDTTNSDLAFWGKRLFAGNYGGFRILDISHPSKPKVLSDFTCNGAQNDVSVWGSPREQQLLFLSIDRPQDKETCDSQNTPASTPGFEGIRILDVTHASHPELVKAVPTDCGSHTNTLLPDLENDRVLIYVASYPLQGQSQDCNVHFKVSIVEVPLSAPENASVIRETLGLTAPAIGCHDVTVVPALEIAAAACISEGEIWDISDPDDPSVLAKIHNPAIQIWHSATFTNDGQTVWFGDEAGGGAAPFCATTSDTTGRIWAYDVSDPSSPTGPLGSYKIPRSQGSEICTAHNFNFIPYGRHDLLVSSWYGGATSVVNLDDPAAPREIGFYDAQEPTAAETWSSYFYNGFIYANDILRGVDVFALEDPAARRAERLGHLNPQTQEFLIP
jgi:hypothetical protein